MLDAPVSAAGAAGLAAVPAAGVVSVSPAPDTVALPAWNPFLAAAPRPAIPPATAPTPLASVPTPLPIALPILFRIGPSCRSDSLTISFILIRPP